MQELAAANKSLVARNVVPKALSDREAARHTELAIVGSRAKLLDSVSGLGKSKLMNQYYGSCNLKNKVEKAQKCAYPGDRWVVGSAGSNEAMGLSNLEGPRLHCSGAVANLILPAPGIGVVAHTGRGLGSREALRRRGLLKVTLFELSGSSSFLFQWLGAIQGGQRA